MHDPMHDIDDLFYNNIEGYSVYPPDRVWNKIDADLDKDKYKRKYKRLRRSALVLLFFLVGFVTYEAINLYNKEKEVSDKDVVAKTVDSSVRENKSVAHTNKNTTNTAVGNTTSGVPAYEALTMQGPIVKGILKQLQNINGQTRLVTDPYLPNRNSIRNESVSLISNENVFPGERETENSTDQRTATSFISLAYGSLKKTGLMNLGTVIPVSSLSMARDIDNRVVNSSKPKASCLSLAAYFTPNIARNEISEDRHYGNRGNRSGNNNNGGGNNNGNNNGGNSTGNNNTNGNNGNNGSNGNNNNGNNNNGVGGGRNHNNHHDINKSESEKIAYSAGVQLNYSISKKVSLETGVNYLTSSTDVKPRKVYAEKNRHGETAYRLNCSSGYSFLKSKSQTPQAGDSIIANDTRNHVSYLGIPVAVEYKIFSRGKFSLNASAGAQANVLLNATTKSELTKNSSTETVKSKIEGLKPVYLSVVASVEAEMQINKSLSVTVAPAGQFGVTNINKRTAVNTRPQYLGLSAGLKWRL